MVDPGLKTIVDARLMEVEMVCGGTGEPKNALHANPQAAAATRAQVFIVPEPKNKAES